MVFSKQLGIQLVAMNLQRDLLRLKGTYPHVLKTNKCTNSYEIFCEEKSSPKLELVPRGSVPLCTSQLVVYIHICPNVYSTVYVMKPLEELTVVLGKLSLFWQA